MRSQTAQHQIVAAPNAIETRVLSRHYVDALPSILNDLDAELYGMRPVVQCRRDDRVLCRSLGSSRLPTSPSEYILSRFVDERNWNSPINSVLWSDTGDRIFVGSFGGSISTWSGKCFEYVGQVEAKVGAIRSMCWNHDRTLLLACGDAGCVTMWNRGMYPAGAVESAEQKRSHNGSSSSSSSGSGNGRGRRSSRTQSRTTPPKVLVCDGDNNPRRLHSIAFAPLHGDTFTACAPPETSVRIWDVTTQTELGACDRQSAKVGVLAWNPRDPGQLLLGMADGSLAAWDARVAPEADGATDGDARREPRSTVSPAARVHQQSITAMVWNDDGRRYLTASRDRSIKLWDARHAQRRPVQLFADRCRESSAAPPPIASLSSTTSLLPHDEWRHTTKSSVREYATTLAWHPQSRDVFASGSSDGVISYWHCRRDATQTSEIRSIVRANDSRGGDGDRKRGDPARSGNRDDAAERGERKVQRADAIADAIARVERDVESARPSASPKRRRSVARKIGEMFAAHRSGRVSDLAFHPEGHVLCSVGADSSIRLWAQCYPDADYENRFELRQLHPRLQAEVAASLEEQVAAAAAATVVGDYSSSSSSSSPRMIAPPAPEHRFGVAWQDYAKSLGLSRLEPRPTTSSSPTPDAVEFPFF